MDWYGVTQYFGEILFLASEVAGSSETSIPFYHIRQCHTVEGHNLNKFESCYFGDRVVRGRILLKWAFEMSVRKTSPELK